MFRMKEEGVDNVGIPPTHKKKFFPVFFPSWGSIDRSGKIVLLVFLP